MIAHELAHSWSGNLVTNATWRDFWLNEGFTTFLERRILGASTARRARPWRTCSACSRCGASCSACRRATRCWRSTCAAAIPMTAQPTCPTRRVGCSSTGSSRGSGRRRRCACCATGSQGHAFQSVTTEQFRDYLLEALRTLAPGKVDAAQVDEWLYQPGLPAFAVLRSSDVFTRIDAQRGRLARRPPRAGRPAGQRLDAVPVAAFSRRHAGRTWRASGPRNSSGSSRSTAPAMPRSSSAGCGSRSAPATRPPTTRLAQYLISIGRRKLIRPLYEELMKTPDGRAFARRVYARGAPRLSPDRGRDARSDRLRSATSPGRASP